MKVLEAQLKAQDHVGCCFDSKFVWGDADDFLGNI